MPSLKIRSLLLLFLVTAPLLTASAASSHRSASFQSAGHKIGVKVFTPAQSGRYPAVLVLHSAAGTLLGKRQLEDFCEALAVRGRVAFFVHYFDRTGTIIAGDKSIHENSLIWTQTIHDAVDFAAAQPEVDARSLGIFGYSLGAYLAVAESSVDPRIDVIAEVSGGIFEGYASRMQRLPATLILHGRADERVPVRNAFALQKRARQLGTTPVVKIYDGEGHVLGKGAAADASQRALRFFDAHLSR